jgi:carnitine O-acetyltransferase
MHPADNFPSLAWTMVLDPSPTPFSREEAAATLAFAMLRVRRQISEGTWEQDTDAHGPLERDSYANFFSRALVPDSSQRLILRDSETQHIGVLVQGRAFQIDLATPGGKLTRGSLAAALRQCVALASLTPPAPGIVTATQYGVMADAYRILCTDSQNFSSLRALSEAIFVICLDEQSPDSDEEAAFQLHAGNPSNRWYLQAIQLVAFQGGRLGVVGNFAAGLQGQPALRVVRELAASVLAASPVPASTGAPLKVNPLGWQLPPGFLDPLREDVGSRLRRAPERILRLSFNRKDAALLGLPMSAAFHLVLLAALVEEHQGRLPGMVLQLVSLRHLEGEGLQQQRVDSPDTLALGEALRAGLPAAALRQAARRGGQAYRAQLADIKNLISPEQLFQQSLRRSPPLLRQALSSVLRRFPEPPELFRLSILPRPPGISLLGRFGVPSLVPTSIWAHPLFEDERTSMVCAPGARSIVDPLRFQTHFERVLEHLRTRLALAAAPVARLSPTFS